MSKVITLLGSTGSIGTQSLDVCRMHGYEVFGLSANSSVDKLLAQIAEFHPKYVAVTDPAAFDKLSAALAGQVDAPKLGYMVKAFINLDMDPQRKPEFYPYIQSCPHVVECNCVTGDYSMLIEVLFGTTQELDQFINHLQQFGRTRTQIVFSTPVEHRGVPVAEPEEKQ